MGFLKKLNKKKSFVGPKSPPMVAIDEEDQEENKNTQELENRIIEKQIPILLVQDSSHHTKKKTTTTTKKKKPSKRGANTATTTNNNNSNSNIATTDTKLMIYRAKGEQFSCGHSPSSSKNSNPHSEVRRQPCFEAIQQITRLMMTMMTMIVTKAMMLVK